MTIDYSKHRPHPCSFGGVNYRSRLEAKWAHFFHTLDIQFEYEPFDYGDWSPDFLITIPGFSGTDVYSQPFTTLETSYLCEVKPIKAPHRETIKKIADANDWGLYPNLLLLGIGPWTARRADDYIPRSWCERIGWIVKPCADDGSAQWETPPVTMMPRDSWGMLHGFWIQSCNSEQYRPSVKVVRA